MNQTKLTPDEFWERQEEYDAKARQEFVESMIGDLKEAINYLIVHRQFLKEEGIKRLEREAEKVTVRLEEIEREKILEEIKCFRDVMALHKQLVQENGGSSD